MVRSRTALSGAIIVLVLIGSALLAPWISPYDPVEVNILERTEPPSFKHWMGTDNFGRDIFSRVLWGSRLSLLLGFGSVALGGVLGVGLGLIAGYAGGWLDTIFMRLVDVFLAFGLLLMAVLVMAVLGTGLANVMIAIGLFIFVSFARLTRGEVLGVKEREYVEAAKAIGVRSHRIVLRHILPNTVSTLVVLGTLRLGGAILAEASLSFLGLGPAPPTPSWGLMVNEGLALLRQAPWISLMPSFAIILTVLGFNLLGDGLRDALDPRLRGV
jgi:ABC-type dipeptide/oligopeptide/nickel transport system permease subunit